MVENITYRNAGMEDLPAIVDIYNSTIPSRKVTADTEPVSVNERIDWFKEHNRFTRPLWVVEYQGQICGWASFQSFSGRPAYDATAEVSIYIDQGFRGKGIGKDILRKLINACPQLEIDTLLAFIFAHNHESLRLFTHFHFEKWGQLPNIAELDGKKRDVIILGRKI
ncbi:phosphinothricin acetyltransferase [Salinibacillus kushneri]|uniref:Phosphinothricin acetyltransferase n=1 Tax=Salinibacillus kushneri TaxID=237682 RepID=A0A1I0G3S6_9BACI|nr:GNAT family N-acetyltransferase [Salinibacillus kushneri]SET65388.1 phosphinothricin acetyltransferase [Salinibacillus kushneri]